MFAADITYAWYNTLFLKHFTWMESRFIYAVATSLFCNDLWMNYQKQSPKGVLKHFAKFSWKHQGQSLFFNKVGGLRPATLLKKRLWYSCFPVNFAKFLRISFFIEPTSNDYFWIICSSSQLTFKLFLLNSLRIVVWRK